VKDLDGYSYSIRKQDKARITLGVRLRRHCLIALLTTTERLQPLRD